MSATKHRTLAKAMAEAIGATLVGGTITGVVLSPDHKEYGFTVKCRDGKSRIAWVMSDEEGNGTGFLEITEHQKED